MAALGRRPFFRNPGPTSPNARCLGRLPALSIRCSCLEPHLAESILSMSDIHSISHYDYDLPKELIAQNPLERREDARLMLINRTSGEIEHWHVRDLPDILKTGDLLVLNDSKVIPAKLVGRREKTGGRWHGLFLRQTTKVSGSYWQRHAVRSPSVNESFSRIAMVSIGLRLCWSLDWQKVRGPYDLRSHGHSC
ncbi:MAG: S-adenosylmethionine:tRNA ribosyltransferase-isomerase [Pirellulaceae bacterium]